MAKAGGRLEMAATVEQVRAPGRAELVFVAVTVLRLADVGLDRQAR